MDYGIGGVLGFGESAGNDTLGSMFETSLGFSVNQVPAAPNTIDTVPTDALGSMTPVSQAGTESWSGFWRDTLRGVIGYSIAKDAKANGVVTPAVSVQQAQAAATYQRQQQSSPIVLLALAGLAVYAMKG